MNIAKNPPAWMKSVDKFPGRVTGAGASNIADGHALACEAWGVPEYGGGDSGLTCFAYLWRRFGPPWMGSDDYKELCCYYLSTPMEGVWLWVSPRGSGISSGVGYMVAEKLAQLALKPMVDWHRKFEKWRSKQPDTLDPYDAAVCRRAEKDIGKCPRWPNLKAWRKQDGVVRDVNTALFAALRELLRPVFIRDCPINILGRCEVTSRIVEAPVSDFAGFPVPRAPMVAAVGSMNRRQRGSKWQERSCES